MSEPLVTVIIPTYNRAELVGRALAARALAASPLVDHALDPGSEGKLEFVEDHLHLFAGPRQEPVPALTVVNALGGGTWIFARKRREWHS